MSPGAIRGGLGREARRLGFCLASAEGAGLSPDELVPAGSGVAHRPAQQDLAGRTAEREVPLREERGHAGGVDATRRRAVAAGGEREHEQDRPGFGRVGDRGGGALE